MSISSPFRRAMAGAVAALAILNTSLAPLAAETPQATQASPSTPAPHKLCVPFNNTQRREAPYDEAMGKIADKLKSYSGWEELVAGARYNNYQIEGLCPDNSLLTPARFNLDLNGFAVTVRDLSSRSKNDIPPPLMVEKFDNGKLDHLAERVIFESTMLAAIRLEDRIDFSDKDFETVILINSLGIANSQAHLLTYAVEHAINTGRSDALKTFYDTLPEDADFISDLHTAAIVAHRQNRTLTAEERQHFRDRIISVTMKDISLRAAMVRTLSEAVVPAFIAKAETQMGRGEKFTPPQRKPFNAEELNEYLDNLPGNIGKNPDVKNYVQYWKTQRALGKDPLNLLEKALIEGEKDVRKIEKEIAEKQQGLQQEAQKEESQQFLQKPERQTIQPPIEAPIQKPPHPAPLTPSS